MVIGMGLYLTCVVFKRFASFVYVLISELAAVLANTYRCSFYVEVTNSIVIINVR